jgi:hypothetical protein
MFSAEQAKKLRSPRAGVDSKQKSGFGNVKKSIGIPMPTRSAQTEQKTTELGEDSSTLKPKSLIQKLDPKSRRNLKMRKE